ncbi:KAR9-domain-containing protein [Xylaria sp. CBS 124048]|nr:KAR9-domain-containing protein [Xylaria sp. CBS 124048]
MTGLSTTSAPSPLSLSPPSHLHNQPYQHHQEPQHSFEAPRVQLSLSSPPRFPSPSLSSLSPRPAHSPAHSPTRAPQSVRQHVAVDRPEHTLTFSDLSSDLLQLDPIISSPRRNPQNPPNTTSPTGNASLPLSASASASASAAAAAAASSAAQRRKPSPGLAARLRALGFGLTSKESSETPLGSPQHESIGRISEEQIRSLDLNHQLHSAALIVERRGRPWKGAGTPLQLLRSRSSRDSFRKASEHYKQSSPEPTKNSPKPELLPEISQTQPLEMDTNLYVLPDQANEDNIKTSLATGREPLKRDTRAPQIDGHQSPPPPPPPPKDTPSDRNASADFSQNLPAYFNPLGLQRPGSIYTISRASFANQLAQLTSLQLPDAELLSNKVAAIPTAQLAAKALIGAAEQIRSWISKANEVIEGLDSEDDVEWAAAGGREGYEEVENAITRFEELINVYVTAIEAMQSRHDIAEVSNEDLQNAVTQMELIMVDWTKIRKTLNNAKSQVETAMEWEELWNMVLGDIQKEMDDLGRLVFEMEERRHKSIMAVSSGDGVDISDLETIIEETPPAVVRNNRYSMPAFPVSPSSPESPPLTQDDSSLLALFARMQPLRASLDFLPMRLSVFEARASGAFPTACEELEMRRTGLEAGYKKLEKDADSLRKELGEDKWVLVFRGAGRQAQKLVESVDRSMAKLRESVDQGLHLSNPPVMGKKIENYEAKKMHYGPAIERVLSIIDKGVKDRLTVNGEILRFHTEIQSRWEDLKQQMTDMDGVLEEIQADKRNQQLRDSISSLLSNDRSTIGSGNETPGSSPPSSVVMSSLGLEPTTPMTKGKNRSVSTSSGIPQSSARRFSSLLAPPSRRTPGSRLSTLSNLSTPMRSGSATPVSGRPAKFTPSVADNRPRWSQYVSTRDSDVGHNFKPLSLTTPSPYTKSSSSSPIHSSPRPHDSKLPMRSPLSRRASASPIPENLPSKIASHSRLSFRDRITASPVPHGPEILLAPKQRSASKESSTDSDYRRTPLQQSRTQSASASARQRSVSSQAAPSRRTSLLPVPKASDAASTGRVSAAGSHKSNSGIDLNKPRWRY